MKEIFLDYLEVSAIAGIIILAVALLSAVIDKKFTAKWKYWVWILIALRLIVPFSFEMESAPARIEVAVPDRVISAPARPENVPREDLSTEPNGNLSTDIVPTVPRPDSGAQTAVKEISLLDAVAVIWIIGAAVVFIWNTGVYFVFRRRTLASGKPANGNIEEALSSVKGELSIKNDISVMVCKNVKSPMVMGFLSPKLVLPDADYGETELYFILRHELTHYRRRDTLYKAVLLLANALHWFNPAVWLMQKLAGADLEVSCDALVVEGGDMETRRRYSETILASVHKEKAACGVFSTHFYGGAKTLKKRFANILSTEKRKKGITAFIAVLIVTAVLGSAVACSADSGLPSDEEVMELIAKAQSVYQPKDYTVIEAKNHNANFTDSSYYEEIPNFEETVSGIFSENGIAELKAVQIPETEELVLIEKDGKYYRRLSTTDEDIIYYNAVLSVELIEQNENSFIYEIIHTSLDKIGNEKEYTSYITIVKENGNYLVESFDSKRYALPGKEATGGSAFYTIEYSEPEIIADHIAALNQFSWGNYGAEIDYGGTRPGTFLFNEYPDNTDDVPDAVTFERVYKGELSDGTYNGYYIDPFDRMVFEVRNYTSKQELYDYLGKYLSEDLYKEDYVLDSFFEIDGKLYKDGSSYLGRTYRNCEIISQTEDEMVVSAHIYNEFMQQEDGTAEIIFEKQNGNWIITFFGSISGYEENWAKEVYSSEVHSEFLKAINNTVIAHRDGTYEPMENHHAAYPEDFPSLAAVESVAEENVILAWRETIESGRVTHDGAIDYIVVIDKTHAIILEPAVFIGDWGTSYGFGNTGYLDAEEAGYESVDEWIKDVFTGTFQSEKTVSVLDSVKEKGTSLTRQEIDRVSEAFKASYIKDGIVYAKMLSGFLISYYDNPQGMNAIPFLYYFPSGILITDEAEFDDLKKTWESYGKDFPKEAKIEDWPVPLHKIPKSMVSEALEKYMGITVEELKYFDIDVLAENSIYYMEKYDCFYSTASDAHGSYFRCVSGEKFSDGTVILYGENECVLTLKLHPDGSYKIYSYQYPA